MNDSTVAHKSDDETSRDQVLFSPETPPQFGAVDIVEAFTAMRHEWRTQTKESRSLAEQIQSAVMTLQSLEPKLRAAVRPADPSDESRQLALLIIETDHQFSRAVTAVAQWEANRRSRETVRQQAIQQQIAAMSGLARWFAGPLLALLPGGPATHESTEDHPAIDGLNMVVARLRRMMFDCEIERIDVLGQPFDAETMHAIGTVASMDYPPGHVAEQLAPAYRWQGRLLRFADVRVVDQARATEIKKEDA